MIFFYMKVEFAIRYNISIFQMSIGKKFIGIGIRMNRVFIRNKKIRTYL